MSRALSSDPRQNNKVKRRNGHPFFVAAAASVLVSRSISASAAAPPPGPANLIWDNQLSSTGDGLTWDNGTGGISQNWNNGGTPSTFTQGAPVTFNDSNNGHYTVNLASNVLPSSVNVSSSGSYIFESIGGFTIRDYISPTTLTQSGGGSLTIENHNTFTGAISVSDGGTFLHLTSTGSLATGQLTVAAGSSAQIDGLLTGTPAVIANGNINFGAAAVPNNDPTAGLLLRNLSSLAIGSGAKVVIAAGSPSTATILTVGSLSDSGTLDLNNGELFIKYGAGPDPIASIAAWLASGYAGGNWNGTGIISTQAISNPAYGLGYADSADPGNPGNLPSGTIEVMYTLLGDANLDGAVNGTDFAIMAANFNKADQPGHSGWDEGDFNYDGSVNGADFAELAANFNQGASQSADVAALDSFAAANDVSLSNVPEPAAMGLLVMAGLGILNRRRRSSARAYDSPH